MPALKLNNPVKKFLSQYSLSDLGNPKRLVKAKELALKSAITGSVSGALRKYENATNRAIRETTVRSILDGALSEARYIPYSSSTVGMRTHLEPKVFLNGLTGGAIAGASMGFVDGYLRKPIVAKNWVPSAIAAGSTLGAVISGTYLGDSLLKKGNGNIEKSASIMGRLGEASSRMLDGAVLGWIDGASRNLLTSTKAAKNELYKLNKINMAKGVAGPDINMDQASLAAKKAIWNAVYVGGEMGSASGAFNGIVRGFVYGPKKIVKPIDKIKAQIPAIAYGSAALAGTTAGGIYGSNLYLKRIHKDQ